MGSPDLAPTCFLLREVGLLCLGHLQRDLPAGRDQLAAERRPQTPIGLGASQSGFMFG